MSQIHHHIPEPMLMAYAAGTLEHSFALLVAAHVSMCDDCRSALGAHEAVGGALLEQHPEQAVSARMKDALFAQLDDTPKQEPEVTYGRSGVFPGPVMQALKGQPPRWKSVGGGVRQTLLHADAAGSVRLLYIAPGRAVPDHGHNGIELTLVLQGAFRDETGRFGVGDLEVADDTVEHTPVAELGAPCICLAATDAPLRFNSLIPRLLQPLLRI
ncbi:ChrR family anti-sigma-E factor [Marinovum sp. 2_MG-2023]|uniref:ChrR family anti-sigma-E factor n=1 Tax=unclassified Marinovum TaxID=2647166 RepID=UPI0026E136C6|nr:MULTISPECIES: ChrR family anti-sigma-E factor [unclassified Marinovum]MDO6732859.1 ChrR family anti-sigma-E factor [Marinovum sp. 2_MG-2023]MDO6782137.1 ChrR family anti-sigma-E factor [Marinovum sp. 1_MG-2023]